MNRQTNAPLETSGERLSEHLKDSKRLNKCFRIKLDFIAYPQNMLHALKDKDLKFNVCCTHEHRLNEFNMQDQQRVRNCSPKQLLKQAL